jgi:hypothetical protein
MAIAYQGPATVLLNNNLLVEAMSVSIDISSNKKEVMTMRKGWAGTSVGPGTTKIDIENAVPKAGLEFDIVSSIQGGDYVRVVVVAHGKRYECEMAAMEGSFKMSTSDSASFSVSLQGGPAKVS